MTLDHLIAGLPVLERRGASDVEFCALGSDSRAAAPGYLFTAIAGTQTDGHDFVPDVLARGVAGVILARWPENLLWPPSILGLRVADPRRFQAMVAHRGFGEPSLHLRVFAVTGTNGKTTTTYLLRSILQASGLRAAALGTTGCHWTARDGSEHSLSLSHTTPDGPELMELLGRLVADGVEAVALELSSHALAQGRAAGLALDACGWTNLSRDHLDFHGTMARYEEAKALLLTEWLPSWGKAQACAVLCVDDPAVADHRFDWPRSITVARDPQSSADLRPVATPRMDLDGIRGSLRWGEGTVEVETALVGSHNLQNLLVAAGMALGAGLPPSAVSLGLARTQGAPGRLERVHGRSGAPIVFVDYAHTDDALTQVLAVLRPHTRGRLHVVFGCGGDRDHGKRPLMGLAAWKGADQVFTTSDNPRREDPERILDDALSALPTDVVATALHPLRPVRRIRDRAEAIEVAIRGARSGDVVLVAGKGHETTQEIAGILHPFDDRAHVRAALETWR